MSGSAPTRRELSARLPYPCPVTAQNQVTVRFFAGARAAAGCDQVMVEPGSIEDVIESIHVAFPALKAVTPVCSFLVDSVSAKRSASRSAKVLDGGTIVHAGSTVDVLPPFAGG